MANTARLVIDPVSRKISTKYEKIRLVQHDNNSTRVTFEMPRHVRGHDMSRCSTVEVHYDNISLDRKQKRSDVYVVTDIIVAPEDDETINFSWLVSRGATQIVGNLDFSMHFGCNEDPDLEYAWHTTPYSGIVVLEGKHNTPSVVEKHPDLVASILDYVDKKISEFDAVEIAQETGESTEAVMSQKATTDALGGKVDVLPVTSGYWAYVTNGNNPNTRLLLSGNANSSGNIPFYVLPENSNTADKGATINVTTPAYDNNAANKKFVEDGLAGKVSKASNKSGKNIPWYDPSTDDEGSYTPAFDAVGGTIPIRSSNGEVRVGAPKDDNDAANKKFVEDGFVAKVSNTYVVYGTGGVKDGVTTQRYFALNAFGNNNGDVVQWILPDNAKFDTTTPNCTIAVCDPQKPYQVANKRYVDAADATLQADMDFLKRHAFGTLYDLETVESTENPVTVPTNALSEATIDKIGTGIKTEVIDLTESVSNASAPTGVTATYVDGLYILHSTDYAQDAIIFSAAYSVPKGVRYYLSAEVVSGSYEIDGGGVLQVGETLLSATVGSSTYGEALYDISGCDIVINTSWRGVKYNNLALKISIGTEKATSGTPVVSVKKGDETVYTVPEAIRALTYDPTPSSLGAMPVYGLAMSDIVYNYLDIEKKQYVIKCAQNVYGEISVSNATIDVSEYLTDDDGEITVAAGDEILFVDAEGNSAGSTVPNTITYAVKKGG